MLKKIKSFSFSKETSPAINPKQKDLDKKLVYSLNEKKIPSLRQIKYVFRVLNQKEKKIISGFLVVIFFAVTALGVNFYFKNLITVPTIGGEYTSGLVGAPQYINPLLSQTNDVDSDISRLIFSGLVKYDRHLQIIPDLASSWEESEDQQTYTFFLKPGISWHDGTPLTADDVIFTFQSLKDPDFKSPLLISLRGVTVEKIDNLTVKFTLPGVYPAFLEVLTFGILPEHIWGEIPPINANLTEFNLKPIGSGPWKFQSLQKDRLGNVKSYTIVPYENFYGPKPYIQKMTFKFYPDFESAVGALKNNSVEGISFLPKELKSELAGKKELNFHSFYLPQYTAMFFNQKQNELLKNKEIRKALALSIDKTTILSEALQLEGEIIDGPILPVNIDVADDKKINFDPNQAMLLLENAGWTQITAAEYKEFIKQKEEQERQESEQVEANDEAPDDETEDLEQKITEAQTPTTTEQITPGSNEENKQEIYRKNKDGVILAITLTTVNQPENKVAAQLIMEAWQKIGVEVDLQIVEGSKISREIIKPRNFDVLLFGIIVGSNPDPYPFWHSSQVQDPGLNLAQFANREVDKLLEDSRKIINEEEQRKNYQRFNDILVAELPAIFLHTPTYTFVATKKIKGVDIERIIIPADRFNNLEDWYIKTKKQLKANFN